MIHTVKCRSDYFNALLSGKKKFEVRKNDREYKVGDLLAVNEIDNGGRPTDRCLLCKIIYMLDDFEGLKKGYVVMGISPVKSTFEF